MHCTAHSEEALERYAMGLSEEPEIAELEEHLLICPECRDTVAFVDAISDAAHALRRKPRVLSMGAEN